MKKRYEDPRRAFIERKKLAHEHRREFRGAVRELKRDAAFIANETLKAKKEASDAYNAKIKRIMGSLGTQEGEMRKFEKKGFGRKKRK